MKSRKPVQTRAEVKFSFLIAAIVLLVGAALSFLIYFVVQRSFFQTMVDHEKELMCIMETLGSQLLDNKLYNLKAEVEETAEQYEGALTGSEADKEEVLASIELGEYGLHYCYQTRQALFCGGQLSGDYAGKLDLSGAWEGETILFSPDFDTNGNYILAIAAPVLENQSQEVDGILIAELDGYCLSEWMQELFSMLDFGTAYAVDGSGRNIATAREKNYDWITMRYNAQELAKEQDDESTQSVAKLERYALDGKTGIDTYVWEGSTNYVAYGPLTETDWGFYVGFYGDKFKKYSEGISSASTRAAEMMLMAFALFSGIIMAVTIRNLNKERRLNEQLFLQKAELEQQALRIAASEERFRIAMQRSKDIILEYQLETGEITCFCAGREMKSGRVGEEALRKRILEDGGMDEESFARFEEALKAISRGLTSAECMLSGDHGEGKKWYCLSLSAVPNGSQMATRAVGILRDMTGEYAARLDSLTKLLNKAAMTNSVRDAMQKNLPGAVSAFVMLDIDRFKLVNDKYGHPAGDQMLCAIADDLREVFPSPYLTGRFGGDEFSVYCSSDVKLPELENRLRQLSAKVKQMQGKNHKVPGVSLSIGVVIFRGKAQFEKIYKKADEMLYEAKEAGKDCWRIFEIEDE